MLYLEQGDGSTADAQVVRLVNMGGESQERNKYFRLELAGNKLLNFFKKEKKSFLIRTETSS